MELPRAPPLRSSSIPRNYARLQRGRGFTLEDALALLTQLQAIDRLLHSQAAITELDLEYTLSSAAIQSIDEEREYEKAQQQLPVMLEDLVIGNRIRRADGIPAAYVKAYKAALAGRTYINEIKLVDFILGPEPSCSQALQAMPEIDELIGTKLKARFDALHDEVKPFPFLRLPAELRLAIYSNVMPQPNYFDILPRYPGATKRADFNVLLTCRQIHDEVLKHFYKCGLLRMTITRSFIYRSPNTDTIRRALKSVVSMTQSTRDMFKKMEIVIATVGTAPSDPWSDPITMTEHNNDPFVQMLALLSSLDTVLIRFTNNPFAPSASDLKTIVEWLANRVPVDITLQWDFSRWKDEAGEAMVREKMKARGGVED